MRFIASLLMLFTGFTLLAQVEKVNEQLRYNSDSRYFYIWSEEKQSYELKDSEAENSIIDIREIGSKGNGYIAISLVDDGNVRTYHGSIVSYSIEDNHNETWVMRSKNARGKLVLDPEKKTFTYSYESNEKRYVKIFVFFIKPDDVGKD